VGSEERTSGAGDSPSTPPARTSALTLGLIPAPDIPEKIAVHLALVPIPCTPVDA
jgi:hypothetical protein